MRVGLALVALLSTGLLAGCVKIEAPPAQADDGVTTLDVRVMDEAGSGIGGATVTLAVPGAGSVRKATDASGGVRFNLQPAPACSLVVERAGFQGGAVALDCLRDQSYRLTLRLAGSAVGGVSPAPVPIPAPGAVPGAGSVVLRGVVTDERGGAPLAGVTVRLDPPDGPAQVTAADGAYAFEVLPGRHLLVADAPCWVKAEFPLEVDADTTIDLRLAGDLAPPASPAGLRATGGPGPGMVAVAWDAVPGATGYDLLRGDPPQLLVRMANTLAYGVHEASAADRFWVAARNGCGFAGPLAGPVSAEPLSGAAVLPLATTSATASVDVATKSYPVRDAAGNVVRQSSWRTVLGTGNCCENHVVTSSDGRIVDIGAETVYESLDEGRSWSTVRTAVPPPCGEGAGAAAPDGDLVMFDWVSCIPVMDDQVFAFKYSKATDRWYGQILPIHAPFYDRPWMAVVKGPFEVEGMIVPYLTFAIGGYPSKEVMLVSLDGLHFAVPSSSSLDALRGSVIMETLGLDADADRDWLQPSTNSGITPLDHGLGLRYGLNLLGGPQLLKDGLTWGDADLRQASLPAEAAVQADARGTLHAVTMEEDEMRYEWSQDGGRTWNGQTVALGGVAGSWDFRAQSGLDEMVVAVQVQKDDGDDQFRAYRFVGLAGAPRLQEVLDVGLGDEPFRGALTGGGARFDFMTVGFLPDGRIVMSFGDSQHPTPAIAIELPSA